MATKAAQVCSYPSCLASLSDLRVQESKASDSTPPKEQTTTESATAADATTTVVSKVEEVVVQRSRGAFGFVSSALRISRSISGKTSSTPAKPPAPAKPPTESAKQTAILVKSIIIGPTDPKAGTVPAVSKQQLNKINSQLTDNKKANEIISHLRTLSVGDDKAAGQPIHAVCLAYTEEEADRRHFSLLAPGGGTATAEPTEEAKPAPTEAAKAEPTEAAKAEPTEAAKTEPPQAVLAPIPALVSPKTVTSEISALQDMWSNMHVINLITAPGLGLGQPGDGAGLLAGAVPTAATIIEGIDQITPQLMSIGFAAGKAIVISHAGAYDPQFP
jgi:hypothetical protein